MDWLAAHTQEAVTLASAGLGVWVVLQRLRAVIRTEIQATAATKEDIAALNAKVDTILTLAFARRRK